MNLQFISPTHCLVQGYEKLCFCFLLEIVLAPPKFTSFLYLHKFCESYSTENNLNALTGKIYEHMQKNAKLSKIDKKQNVKNKFLLKRLIMFYEST